MRRRQHLENVVRIVAAEFGGFVAEVTTTGGGHRVAVVVLKDGQRRKIFFRGVRATIART